MVERMHAMHWRERWRAIGRTWQSAGVRVAAGLLAVVLVACVERMELQAEQPQPQPQTTVVLGADQQYPPFSFRDAEGAPTGFDVELFEAVARHAGLQPRVELGQWDQVLARLETGEVQVVPMLVGEERARRFGFSRPFLYRHHLVFGRAGADHVESLDDLAGHRVAVQTAGMAWEEARRISGVELVEVDVEGAALRAVEQDRADYAMVPSFIGFEAIRRYRLQRVVALSPPLLERRYAFAVSPRHPELVARIDSGLKASLRAGAHNDLYMKWLANLVPSTEVYRSGLALGLAVALVLFVVSAVLLVRWLFARKRAASESLSRAHAEARALQLERFDAVTRLPNRAAFVEALQPLIDAGSPFALVQIELLELDAMQAMAGQGFADALLRNIADRLRGEYGDSTVARLGTARFALVSRGAGERGDARTRMQALLQRLKQRADVAGIPVEQACRAGAALFPAHGRTVDALLRNSGLALSEAHARATPCLVYDPALEPDPRNLTLLADLSQAIHDGTLGYALQPRLDLASGRIVGAELLVRWRHAVYGALAPAEFVPLAEKTELISEMTVYLVRCAVARLARWGGAHAALHLAINVSVNDLADAAVVERITQACRGHAGRVVLEVTETAVMRDPVQTLAAIGRLRACGLKVALDDFGTGNASLSFLRQLRPDEVKIDRSFTAGILDSAADQAIVRSTIDLAHVLGARVTAEGVEDGATLEWLAAAGCDCAQGYLIARPLPLDEFERFVQADSDLRRDDGAVGARPGA
jgi:EAL domain-containing protein (putative c-di-GMP-specific phosphodiesterase class I)/ABC-type amino acid transport substrate-binding protein/GGDEF domain-containing protein